MAPGKFVIIFIFAIALGGSDARKKKNKKRLCGFSDEPKDLAAYAKSSKGMEIFERMVRTQKNPLRKSGSLTIPVYFHIITDKNGNGDIANTVLDEQIKVMNDGFSGQDKATCGNKNEKGATDTAFRFEKAGVTRTRNNAWYTATYQNDGAMKKKLRKGGCETLNIYINNMGQGLLGYATWPTDCGSNLADDGVVLLGGTLPGGATKPFNLGDTATHEVGHWLGLFHTFEGGCGGKGDEVSDTPAQKASSSGCPVNANTCSAAGSDPIYNFMDYSDDCCMFKFTEKQNERMDFYHQQYRDDGNTDDRAGTDDGGVTTDDRVGTDDGGVTIDDRVGTDDDKGTNDNNLADDFSFDDDIWDSVNDDFWNFLNDDFWSDYDYDYDYNYIPMCEVIQRQCDPSCGKGKRKNWKINCALDRSICGGCSKCEPNPNKCDRNNPKCNDKKTTWGQKCDLNACAACNECFFH